MSVISSIKRIKKEEKERQRLAEIEAKEEQKEMRKNQDCLYDLFRGRLMEVDGETIDKCKITIQERAMRNAPTYNELIMSINGTPYASFRSSITYHYCNCSECAEGGSCGRSGGPSYSFFIKAESCNTEKFPYPSTETIRDYEIEDEILFSKLILGYLKDFDWKMRFK